MLDHLRSELFFMVLNDLSLITNLTSHPLHYPSQLWGTPDSQ